MCRVGLSSCGKIVNENLFEKYAESGIYDIELSEGGGEYSAYDGYDFKNVSLLAKKHGANIWSLHLPFWHFKFVEPSALDKSVRQNTIKVFSEIIKRGADVGIDKFIVHPSGEPIDDKERSERLKCASETLSMLADVCEKTGGVICVEDLPRTCLGNCTAEMKFLTTDERLKICFDTNHITCEKPENVINALGNKIVTLHVSDYDFVDERHWLPGEGLIDWKNVISALKNVGYNGSFMYEIGFETPKTIARSRNLTCDDFARNANELFAGNSLTVIPKQK